MAETMVTEDGYTYYVRLEFPEYPDPEKPLAIYRAQDNNILTMEALRRDGKWHYSKDLVQSFMFGDTMTVEKVTREIAERAINNLLPG